MFLAIICLSLGVYIIGLTVSLSAHLRKDKETRAMGLLISNIGSLLTSVLILLYVMTMN